MTKLTNIVPVGRYQNNVTLKKYNIRKGRNLQRGTDILFYLYRGSRIYISDRDFYDGHTKIND